MIACPIQQRSFSVGKRGDISTPSGGATRRCWPASGRTRVFAVFAYPAGSNRLSNVKIGT